MKNTEQLINNLIGQLNGIKRMTERNEDCFKVLTQMKAVKAGIASLMDKYTEKQFMECLDKKTQKKEKEKIRKLFAEVVKN